jgi:hypothetical protein
MRHTLRLAPSGALAQSLKLEPVPVFLVAVHSRVLAVSSGSTNAAPKLGTSPAYETTDSRVGSPSRAAPLGRGMSVDSFARIQDRAAPQEKPWRSARAWIAPTSVGLSAACATRLWTSWTVWLGHCRLRQQSFSQTCPASQRSFRCRAVENLRRKSGPRSDRLPFARKVRNRSNLTLRPMDGLVAHPRSGCPLTSATSRSPRFCAS